jgi:hypothetical protein
MIAAVAAVKDEADVIEVNIRHLFAHGIDLIRISDGMSTDGTADILEDLQGEFGDRLEVLHAIYETFYQERTMNALAGSVGIAGADWIIPFDADEFFYPAIGGTIAEALDQVQQAFGWLHVPSFKHLTWEQRFNVPGGMGKVVFRWKPGAHLTMGNHEVHNAGEGQYGVLELRELQFRGWDHFCAKVALNLRTLDRTLPEDKAVHYRVLEGLDQEEMEVRWREYQEQPVLFDPIPVLR